MKPFLSTLEDILKWILDNRQWVFSGIGVPLVIWLGVIIFSRFRRRAKVTYRLGIAVVRAGQQLSADFPYFEVRVLNVGTQEIFIRAPQISLSRSINGDKTFRVLGVNEQTSFPLRLAPGQEFTRQLNLKDLQNQLLSKLVSTDKLRFEVVDTLGKCYRSGTVRVQRILDHIAFRRTQT